MFLLEGLPAIVLGFVTLFYLVDRPRHARWLDPEEKAFIENGLAREAAAVAAAQDATAAAANDQDPNGWRAIAHALARREIALLVLAYFGIVTTSYGFSLWMPTVVKSLSGLGNFAVTVVAMVPYLSGALCTLVAGWSSDRTGERRIHTLVLMLMAAAGMAIGVAARGAPGWGLLSLALVGGGIYGFMPTFWPMPRWFLSGAAGAAAVGLINSTGCLGGFVGPFLVGHLKKGHGDYAPGLAALGATATFAALMIALVRRPRSTPATPTTNR
jgi:ACS family tartrate transporter-like MFS transporter